MAEDLSLSANGNAARKRERKMRRVAQERLAQLLADQALDPALALRAAELALGREPRRQGEAA